MDNLIDPASFKNCYAQFQTADNNRNAVVTELLNGYETLHKENIRMREKLEDERETRVMWQESARSSKKELTQTRLATVRLVTGPFTTALLTPVVGVASFCRHGNRWRRRQV